MGMLRFSKKMNVIIVLLALFLVKSASQSCLNATNSTCGILGGNCSNYNWINGTCILSQCPSETFWSNATNTCVACVSLPQPTCTSFCSVHGYYYSYDFSGCLKCTIIYGINCLTCNSSNCLSCGSTTILDSPAKSCIQSNCTISFCQKCSNRSICQACETGYNLNSGVCYCGIRNCQLCSGQYCLSCYPGYQTDIYRTSCLTFCIPNCLTCSSYFMCTQCETNYNYNSLTYACQYNCSLIDIKCASCASSTCNTCSSGYSLNSASNNCYQSCNDVNCISCLSSKSLCDACSTGYKLNSTYNCIRDVCSITNCQICGGVNQCSQCLASYVLSADKTSCLPSCSAIIPNCQTCSSNNTCKTCASGYTFNNSKCTSQCNIKNCLSCASPTTCMVCQPGTLMGYSSLSCNWNCGINGCRTCSSLTACQSCYSGYTLSSDFSQCLIVCPDGYYLKNGACSFCIGTFCQKCTSLGQCVQCAKLFYLNQTDYTCHMCTTIDPYCFNCKAISAICTECQEGFALINNKCHQTIATSIKNCQGADYYNSSVCLICNQGYILGPSGLNCTQPICPGEQFLVGSACTCGTSAYFSNLKCLACPSNCLQCTSSICINCVLGYYASANTCLKCSSNCDTCTSTACLTCNNNFILKNGTCSQTAAALASISFTSAASFVACQAGCKTCDVSTKNIKVCTSANDGYVLVGSALLKCDISCKTCSGNPNSNTTSCLSCYDGYSYIAGICKKCTDSHALTCSNGNPSLSLTCTTTYTLSKTGICTSCANNCLKCDIKKAGSCDSGGCVIGFTQYGGSLLCIPCFNGCSSCNSDPNICTACFQYQYLSNNKCLSCPTNCITCTDSNICTTCIAGYLPNESGQCKIPPGLPCVNYDKNLTCTTCDSHYWLSNGTCIFQDACNSNSSCTTCNYNEYLSSSKCQICPSLPNCNSCDISNPKLCFVCNQGYYLNSTSQTCLICPTGCSKCNNANVCQAAASGYYLIMNLDGSSSGTFANCSSNCKQCIHQAYLCTSCGIGYNLVGNKCLQTQNFLITITGALNGYQNNTNLTASLQLALFYQLFGLFVQQIALALKYPSTGAFHSSSIFISVTRGSLVASFAVNSNSVENPNFQDTLGSLKTINVLSVSTQSNKQNFSNGNLGLILGISIPLVIMFIVIVFVIIRRNQQAKEEREQNGTAKTIQTLKMEEN